MLAEVRALSTTMPPDEFFLARQPILGRDQHLVAYELLFRAAGEHDDARLTDGAAATAAVISHASQLGLEQVVGNKLAFVNVDEVVLMSDFVRFLPPNKVILEILETVKPTEPLLARVAELKELGFKFALDDVVDHSAEVDQLLGLVDVVKIDLQGVAPAALGHLTASLRTSGKKLLAEKVETQQEFRLCQELGFDYFQGYYFARPVILSGRKITPSEMVILHLLELINSDADDATIETAVKRDPLISLNLLRLVNSRAAGPEHRIESVAEALTQLGRKQLRRWLQILMFAAPGSKVELNSPLLQLATTRGKLLELMSLQVCPDDVLGAERAFTVGIMSLADVLFSMPMADILENVELADDVRGALLGRAGDLGAMLEVVERLEKADTGREFTAALRRLDLTSKQVREIELAAFDWVRELVHDAA
ncbi:MULTISPECIES: EAL and HDOD domain-containing protein [unclassified Massilia]|uniref:EAL and HDOD domain-containing protein n=1 Tax=unclassified Massilia TaxID=2609279 RepID=UPI001784DA98|nr:MULTISPECIES: EAL domain-containing protein [unclassified Massilia]MBD8530483.1 EAL domain-containing protein [Massilia sp. CFBP 13647]MBD8674219.1 EAL domain-containing protein [Massilia sp. CFBP 13721]